MNNIPILHPMVNNTWNQFKAFLKKGTGCGNKFSIDLSQCVWNCLCRRAIFHDISSAQYRMPCYWITSMHMASIFVNSNSVTCHSLKPE